jgi:hypothetical protein
MSGVAIGNMLIGLDQEYGGYYQIRGVIDRQGVYGPYRFTLLDSVSGLFVRRGHSDKNGEFLIRYIAYRFRGYTIYADDHHSGSPMNAAIADLVTPEPMP